MYLYENVSVSIHLKLQRTTPGDNPRIEIFSCSVIFAITVTGLQVWGKFVKVVFSIDIFML